MVFESTSEMFAEDIKKDDYVIIDCFATWCNPCKLMKKIFDEFSNKIASYPVKLFSLDIDECPEICSEYEITSVPSLLYFKRGVLYKKESGLKTEQQMIDVINEMKVAE